MFQAAQSVKVKHGEGKKATKHAGRAGRVVNGNDPAAVAVELDADEKHAAELATFAADELEVL